VKTYLDVEDLAVYRKLCELHIDVCKLSGGWPPEEKYEAAMGSRRGRGCALRWLGGVDLPRLACARWPLWVTTQV